MSTGELLLPVFARTDVKAWPKSDGATISARYLPVVEAFRREYRTDAHFKAYSVPEVPKRLSSGAPEKWSSASRAPASLAHEFARGERLTMSRVVITEFSNVWGADAKRLDSTHEGILEKFRTPRILSPRIVTKEQISAEKKRSAMWCPATFQNDERSLETFEGAWGVGFDIDRDGEVPSIDVVGRLLDSYSGFVHTTMSSTPAAPKYRGLLWTNRPISNEEYRALHRHIGASIPGLSKGVNDPCRLWAQPVVKHGGTYAIEALRGEPIDVDNVLASLPCPVLVPRDDQGGVVSKPAPVKPRASTPAKPFDEGGRLFVAALWPPALRFARARGYMRSLPPWTCPHENAERICRGSRCHSTLTARCIALVRGFVISDFDALKLLREWNARNSPPFDDEYLEEQLIRAPALSCKPWGYKLSERPTEVSL